MRFLDNQPSGPGPARPLGAFVPPDGGACTWRAWPPEHEMLRPLRCDFSPLPVCLHGRLFTAEAVAPPTSTGWESLQREDGEWT
ncbi:hypothetical protein [Nonomuraea dietziae]|uniref:hypothetical protein n=1 Tax=Nonomuraea dietziae TaxID=65515 RepID=UPI0031E161CD